jgi:hypothetical protein
MDSEIEGYSIPSERYPIRQRSLVQKKDKQHLALNLSWRYQAKDIFNAKLVKTMF